MISEFGTADGLQMGADPDALTAGPDGNVWFDDQDGDQAQRSGRSPRPARSPSTR